MRVVAAALALVGLCGSMARADVDWRSKGVVTPVQDQGTSSCNRSWAFAVAGVVEGVRAVSVGQLNDLSEQQLIDCATGCDGSATGCADCVDLNCGFEYIAAEGLCSGSSYPYTGQRGTCSPCTPVLPSGFASSWTHLPGEAGIVSALQQAPVLARLAIGVHGQPLPEYEDYHGGVLVPPVTTDDTLVQWVLIVGHTANYWIVKNSLGTSWGSNGYLHLTRGANYLGIGDQAYALQTGAPAVGSCSLPDQSCSQTSESDCTIANGTFGGLGTICPIPCLATGPQPAPTLSLAGIAAFLVLAAVLARRAMASTH